MCMLHIHRWQKQGGTRGMCRQPVIVPSFQNHWSHANICYHHYSSLISVSQTRIISNQCPPPNSWHFFPPMQYSCVCILHQSSWGKGCVCICRWPLFAYSCIHVCAWAETMWPIVATINSHDKDTITVFMMLVDLTTKWFEVCCNSSHSAWVDG